MSKRQLNVKIGNYIPRGKEIVSDFMKDMESFHLLMEYAKDESNGLDVQLRGKYMNIYYQGGSLVKLSGKSNCDIDKNYFYVTGKGELCMSDIERLSQPDYVEKAKLSKALKGRDSQIPKLRKKALTIMKNISEEQNSIISKLKSCKTKEEICSVVKTMKMTMRNWKDGLCDSGRRKTVVGERTVQHYLSLFNKHFDNTSDFIVLDIEYAISTNAIYAKEEDREKQPRIDIIAIEKGTGQIYVMELKYGMKSVQGDASAKKHYEDYCATVGDEGKWQSFIDDIEVLLDAKKRTEIIDKDVTIKQCKPKFAFVLKQEKESDREDFMKELKELEKDSFTSIPTLFLPVELDWDNPKAESNKLTKKFMR
jgi:hypothetical protein